MRQLTICILGGTGFVGSQIAMRLADHGHRIKILSRRPERHRGLRVVPAIELITASIFDPVQLNQHVQHCDAVINLVGILNEKGHHGDGFYKIHTELTGLILDACLRQGVPRLLQMSALRADAEQAPSFYLRSKGKAENLLFNHGSDKLAVTCFRPSVIFGPEDSFFNRFASLLKIAPVIPLACPKARFAPVYVGDVADRFIAALHDRSSRGQAHDLCGPHDYSLLELVRYTATLLAVNTPVIGLPDRLSKLQAHIFEYLPGKPFSVDNYRSLQLDSVCEASHRELTSIEAIVPGYIGTENRTQKIADYRKAARR